MNKSREGLRTETETLTLKSPYFIYSSATLIAAKQYLLYGTAKACSLPTCNHPSPFSDVISIHIPNPASRDANFLVDDVGIKRKKTSAEHTKVSRRFPCVNAQPLPTSLNL